MKLSCFATMNLKWRVFFQDGFQTTVKNKGFRSPFSKVKSEFPLLMRP